jgi:hypothetical protein
MHDIMILDTADYSLNTAEECLSLLGQADPRTSAAEAAFMCTVVHLNDVLQFLKKSNVAVLFADAFDGIDTTDKVNTFRNVACHIKSPLGEIGSNSARFNTMGPKGSLRIRDKVVANPYDDDTAISYGEGLIFLQRHLKTAITQAREKVSALRQRAD